MAGIAIRVSASGKCYKLGECRYITLSSPKTVIRGIRSTLRAHSARSDGSNDDFVEWMFI